jgi:bifunctional phosphoglucose/phosphomannose isomerase
MELEDEKRSDDIRHPLDIIEEASVDPASQNEETSDDSLYDEAEQKPGAVISQYISSEKTESGLRMPSFYDYRDRFKPQPAKDEPATTQQISERKATTESKMKETPNMTNQTESTDTLGLDHVPYENNPEYQDQKRRELTETKRRELYEKDELPKQPRMNNAGRTYTSVDRETAAFDFPDLCTKGFKARVVLPSTMDDLSEKTNVLICAVGQDLAVAELVKLYIEHKYPEKRLHIMTCSDYFLPKISYKDTLTLFISRNSQEKEVLSCYRKAHALNHTSLVITSGGELETLAHKNKTPLLEIPHTFSNVTYSGFLFFFMLRILDTAGMITLDEMECQTTIQSLEQKRETYKEKGKEFAKQLMTSVPLFYSTRNMDAVAKYWKMACNLFAQVPAFTNIFPDVNYGEMFGLRNAGSNFYTIMFEDEHDYHKLKERMRLTQDYIRKNGHKSIILKISGKNVLSKYCNIMYLGIYTAVMLAGQQHDVLDNPMQTDAFLHITKN